MTEHATFVPDGITAVVYTRVNADQAACIERSMELPDNQARFQVSFLPIDTLEQRLVAAREWSEHQQLKRRNGGTTVSVHGDNASPEAMLGLLEDRDSASTPVPFAPFVTRALLKVVKLQGRAAILDLLRDYYDDPK